VEQDYTRLRKSIQLKREKLKESIQK